MTPLDRAARAIAAIDYRRGIRDCERPNEPPVYTPTPWNSLPAKTQAESMEKARAVLEAIREPSEGMIDAGIVGAWPGPDAQPYYPDAFASMDDQYTTAWQAMIDAALAEGA